MRERDFAEFTEAGYGRLLRMAASTYAFERFGSSSEDPHVLWRHDIDMSVHRALRLAQIEADLGLISTYFVRLHSEFYSPLERAILGRLRTIRELGHDIGLHFELAFYDGHLDGVRLHQAVRAERVMLEDLVDAPVGSISFHNPDLDDAHNYDADVIEDMTNAYGKRLRSDYAYISDSNGYWRYVTPSHVLNGQQERVQVLTHGEWWTPEPMSPRMRVARCLEGRSASVGAEYDELLERAGRLNIR